MPLEAAEAIAEDVCGSDIFGIGDVFSISQMVRGGPPFRDAGGVCCEYLEVEVMVDLTGSEWYLGEAPIYPAFIFTG